MGAAAAGVAAVALRAVPELQLEVFAAAAAKLAAWFSGASAGRTELGWLIDAELPIVVSAACSGADFFLLVAALVGARLFGRMKNFATAVVATLALALPLAIGVNALRIVAVAQAHRWAIPWLPERHADFAHMLTGVAVFLPSSIALNLVLEFYGNRRRSSATAP